MSDLISRSELIKRFLVSKDGHRIPEMDCDNFEVTVSVKDVKTIIKEQPTAYDIDKVVEELEKVKTINVDVGYGTIYKTIRKDTTIEIVKQGGVSDDVCECRLLNGHKFLHETSCGDVFDMQNGFKYCPFCGKKIKVVE